MSERTEKSLPPMSPPLAALDAPSGTIRLVCGPTCGCGKTFDAAILQDAYCPYCGTYGGPAHLIVPPGVSTFVTASGPANIPPPPVATPPARTLADELHELTLNTRTDHRKIPGRDVSPNMAYHYGHRDARHAIAEALAAHPALQQPAPVADDAAGRGERRWGMIRKPPRETEWELVNLLYATEESARSESGVLSDTKSHRVVPVIVIPLADDAAPAGAEGAVEMTINTRDEHGVKQPLDPGAAMALGKAAKAIHDKLTIDQLTARLAAAESRALEAEAVRAVSGGGGGAERAE